MRLALRYNFALFHQIEVVAELCCKAQIVQRCQDRDLQIFDVEACVYPSPINGKLMIQYL